MKILTFLLFCFVSVISYAQKSQPQIFPHTAPSLTPQAENWLDTTNMYNSRYGPVARLTQDNMPCIMPYAPVNAIPNAAPKRAMPGEIPNLWKNKAQKDHKFPTKPMPVPEGLHKSQALKEPLTWKKTILTTKPFICENRP
ncbi:hypothetical protein KRR40_30360 [Niabella defluvii]|jgi:hypothetical protein|nr:hypothetical protein KRR40_30360 [Niabella sp. I65]